LTPTINVGSTTNYTLFSTDIKLENVIGLHVPALKTQANTGLPQAVKHRIRPTVSIAISKTALLLNQTLCTHTVYFRESHGDSNHPRALSFRQSPPGTLQHVQHFWENRFKMSAVIWEWSM